MNAPISGKAILGLHKLDKTLNDLIPMKNDLNRL
jgi:hypothetical protein